MKNRPIVKYLSSLVLFGSNGIVASLIALSSMQIVFLRTMLGGLLLVALFLLCGGKFTFYKHKKHFFYLLLSGVATGASWMFLYEAYVQIGVGVASLLYYCGPVIVMALSPLLFGERLTQAKVFGFLIVILGVVFINTNSHGTGGNAFGFFYGVMSAVMYAAMVIFNKKAKSIVGLENSALQIVISFLTVAVFLGVKQGYTMQIEPSSLLPIAILGFVNTGFGCYFYFSAIGRLRALTLSICGYLEPLSAVLMSAVFLGEALSFLQIVGAVLIIGGALLGEILKFKHKPHHIGRI